MAVPQIKGGYFGLQILVREVTGEIRNRSGFFGNRQYMRVGQTLKTKDVAINEVYQGGIRFMTGEEGGITRTIRSGLWDHRERSGEHACVCVRTFCGKFLAETSFLHSYPILHYFLLGSTLRTHFDTLFMSPQFLRG